MYEMHSKGKWSKKLQLKYSSQNVLEAIKKGDPMREVNTLYRFEYPKIKSYVLKNNGSGDDASDVFQESLIQLFRYIKLGKFNEEYEIGAFCLLSLEMNGDKEIGIKSLMSKLKISILVIMKMNVLN